MPGPSALPGLTVEIAFTPDPWSGYLQAIAAMPAGAGADSVFYDATSIGDYLVQAGDYLEYDVWWEGASQYGAVDLGFSDATYLRTAAPNDQNGLSAAPSADLSARADGVWYHRVIPLSSVAGKTVSKWLIGFDPPDAAGAQAGTIRVRELVVTDGSGTTKFAVWHQPDGVPTLALDTQGTATSTIAVSRVSSPPIWTDVTPYFLEAHPRRGRNRETETDEAGTMSLVLDNRDRLFDPSNTSSPYYPNVLPMRRVRVTAIYPFGNYSPDPSFENLALGTAYAFPPPGGWTVNNGGAGATVIETASAFDGGKRVKATATGPSDQASVISDLIPIDRLKTWAISAYFQKLSGAVSAQSRIMVSTYDASGTLLGTGDLPHAPTSGATYASGFFDPPSGTWTRYGGYISPSNFPVNTAAIRILLFGSANPTGAVSIAIDAVQLEVGTAATLFVSNARNRRFTGFIERWPPTWEGKNAEVSLDCVDGFEALSLAEISGFRAVEQSGDRVGWALDQAGWPTPDRNIDVGNSQVEQSGSTTGTLLDNEPALSHIQDVATAEMGAFFIAGDGTATFQQRQRRLVAPYNVSQGVFSNAPGVGEFLYLHPQIVYDKDDIYNDVRSRPVAATTDSIAADVPSQVAYGRRTLSESVWLTTLTECLNRAQYILARRKQPSLRIDGITLDPLRQDALWEQLLGRDLGDRVTVKLAPYGGGPTITKDVFIESVQEDIVARDGKVTWTAQWALSPADTQAYWILGDANLSLLGQSTVLGY